MARKKGLKADYQGATPEQVSAAMLRHRPGANLSPSFLSVSEFGELARHSIRGGIRNFYRDFFPEVGDVKFIDEPVDGIVREGPDAQDAQD